MSSSNGVVGVAGRFRQQLVRCVALLLCAGLAAGCHRIVTEQRLQQIRVDSQPSGVALEQIDSAGHRVVGSTPMTVQKRYSAKVRYFRHWNWVWPALLGVCGGAGFATMGDSDGPDAGLIFGSLCTLGFIPTFIVDVVLAARSGRVMSRDEEQVVFVARQGQLWDSRRVKVPGPVTQLTLSMRQQNRGGTPVPGTGPQVVRQPPPPKPKPTPPKPAAGKPKGPIVAVFEVEDASGQRTTAVLGQLTDYLSAKLTEVTGYRVIPRRLIRARIVATKKDGYKQCYDEACQIELGRALAAQKSLATKLLMVGSACAISATLYDLKSETTERATSVRTRCTEDALMDGMEQIAHRLRQAAR